MPGPSCGAIYLLYTMTVNFNSVDGTLTCHHFFLPAVFSIMPHKVVLTLASVDETKSVIECKGRGHCTF